jgi:bifunctional DNA-binding transcriptional regulator/antitoxin component of YhaV-PrlF toxin-antitoxin module
MTPHDSSDIIDRIAQRLGVRSETRRQWRRRGTVPGRWHLPILEQARQEGCQLEPDALSDYRPTAPGKQRRRRAKIRAQREPPPAPGGSEPRPAWVEVDGSGRLLLPPQMLELLGVRPGERVLIEREGDELRLRSLRGVVEGVQSFVRGLVPDEVSLIDELIAERRGEAEHE